MGNSGEKKQLGKILLKRRRINPDQLEELLDAQKQNPGHRLASTALRSGKVGAVDLLKALSEQHGLPGIDLRQVVIPLENLQLIPEEIARQHLILPILVKEDRVFLAMTDPENRRVIDEIEFVTGKRVFPYVALQDAIAEVIDAAYGRLDQGLSHYIGPDVPEDYLRSLGLEQDVAETPAAEAPNLTTTAPPPSPPIGKKRDGVGVGVVTLEEQEFAPPPITDGLDDAFGTKIEPLPTPKRQETKTAPRVLVVDDEDDIRKLVARMLAQKGYEIVEAASGVQALEMVRERTPDVILLDAMMPELHGFEVCRRIKSSKRYGHIPVIMVSAVYRGWRMAEDLKSSYGVSAFIEKPFKVARVIEAVKEALGTAEAQAAAAPGESHEAAKALEDGMSAYKAGDLDTAIHRLKEGVQIDPLAFQLHYHLGLLCGRADRAFEAIHSLETAVDLDPAHFSALKNLAVLYQRTGFRHKAIEMWERALAAAPDEATHQSIKEHLVSLF